MKFDKTFIAIRERSALELLDLTLHVLRFHFQAIAILAIVGILPWIIIDFVFTYWMVTQDYYLDHALTFYWVTALLVVSQAQIGTTFVTHYLGQAMFVGRPGIMDSFSGVFRTSFFFLWIHLVIRLVLPVLLIVLLLSPQTQDLNWLYHGLLIPLLVCIGLLIRLFRPFASEMLLLERTPVRSKDSKVIRFGVRAKSLHTSASGDAMTRFLLAALISFPLTFVFYSTFCWVDKILNLQAAAVQNFNYVYWPISLWICAVVISVFRFLTYIDTRIRQEGWAVELRMRAEALRLKSDDQPGPFGKPNLAR